MCTELREIYDWLLEEHRGSVSVDRLDVMRDELRYVIDNDIPGAVVEIGCYRGAMSLWMRAVLDTYGDRDRAIHVYDSFQGMPQPTSKDSDRLKKGDLVASAADVRFTHQRWAKRSPVVHPGWFADTLPGALPSEIALAYLDGDFYESILTSLRHCVPRLSQQATLILDDYADLDVNPRARATLPGVKLACDSYFGLQSPVQVVFGAGHLAYGRYRHVANFVHSAARQENS